MEEIAVLIIGFFGGIITMVIKSYLERHNKHKDSGIESDKNKFLNLKSLITNRHIDEIKSSEFYDGLTYDIIKDIGVLDCEFRNENYLNFHDSELLELRNKLKKSTYKLQREIAKKTTKTTSGLLTTRVEVRASDYNAAEEQKKRFRKESDELIPLMNAFCEDFNNLEIRAHKKLIL